jgi:uncharacterized membrane protein
MPHQSVTTGVRSGLDWKALGYIVSIVSVFFLGSIAWPKEGEPRWHVAALIIGTATSIIGMGCRYKAHLDQQRELKKTKAEARRR